MKDKLTQLSSEEKRDLLRKILLKREQESSANQTYPLSSLQKGLLFIAKLNPDYTQYNMPYVFHLEGDLNKETLEKSINEIIRRHITLRTVFITTEEGEGKQFAQPFAHRSLIFTDISLQEEPMRKEQLRRIIHSESFHCFDLSQGPLTRFHLVQTSREQYVLIFVVHHIVFDGVSMGRFVEELRHYYGTFVSGVVAPLSELAYTYATFSQESQSFTKSQEAEYQLQFWKKQLSGTLPVLELPTDYKRSRSALNEGSTVQFPIPLELNPNLRSLGRQEGATLFMIFLSVFYVLLYRYTEQEDILIGTPVSYRERSELMPLIGLLINTIVLRVDLSGEPTFREVLQRVKMVALDAFANQNVSFSKVVEVVQPDRSHGRSPLFQVMFTVEHGSTKEWEMPGVKARLITEDHGVSKYDLTLVIRETPNDLSGTLEFSKNLFSDPAMKRLTHHYIELLRDAVNIPDAPIGKLNLLTPEERQLLSQWNHTDLSFPQEQTIYQLIERKVQEFPQRIAAVDPNASITYEQLDQESDILKEHLHQLQVKSNMVVAICMNRSVSILVAMLGVWKAGAAYLPIDPGHPADRLAFMMEDAKVTAVITERQFKGKLPVHLHLLCMDEGWDNRRCEVEDHLVVTGGDELAYVIYTSGSTGNPKGVGVTHVNAMNLVHWHNRTYGLKEGERTSQLAGISFDAAVWEIWPVLTTGGTLYFADDETRLAPSGLQDWLIDNRINISFVPTPLAEILITLPWPETVSLRALLTGGDKLHRYPSTSLPFELVNHYGPTETTVVATAGIVPKGEYEGAPSIGRPIANTRVYILDKNLNQVPIGVPGELYIGGSGVSKGYIFRPDLTKTAFVEATIHPGITEILYRTGDIVRYLPDGQIEFLGRRDHQVKIRGLRIELGEIETLLTANAGVKEAIVLTQETKSKELQIVAYVTTSTEEPIEEQALKIALKQKLPDYMIPARIIRMDAFPLTRNGKIDRQALPKVETEEAENEFIAPQNRTENVVAAIWAEVLGKERISRTDNFFDIGGHSLLLVRVHEKLHQAFETNIQLLELFQYTTVQQIAQQIAVEKITGSSAGITKEESFSKESGLEGMTNEDGLSIENIAVIGFACRVPGADVSDRFWVNLKEGVDSIRWFNRDELLESGAEATYIDFPNYVPARGYLEGADQFDADFFQISPREAEMMDPQHRVFMENSWEALEHAGYDPSRFRGRIGVYAGSAFNTYLVHNLLPNHQYLDMVGLYSILINNDKDSLATHIAYKLNLTGPAVTVQTACSSSLVALHLACQGLIMNDCDIALAGGVTIRSPLKDGYLYREGEIGSPVGQCKAFDNEARGTIGGMGTGAVVLKRLSQAKKDGDTIYALIKGSAINNDGSHKIGFTAPSVEGQVEVISETLRRARVSPETITYQEAHGTGTPLGDPIEVSALTKAFRKQGAKKCGYCAIGSVKTNIGHLDAAAGVIGFIKTVLALQHGQLPPSLHFTSPNQKIDFVNSPFYVSQQLQKWEGHFPRRAGVSALGVGGTNAYVIVEEAPKPTVPVLAIGQCLMVLSASTKTALENLTDRLSEWLVGKRDNQLADIAYTLQVGRKEFPYRRILVAGNILEAAEHLKKRTPGRVQTGETKTKPSILFLFYGNPPQSHRLAGELYRVEPVFQQEMDQCFNLTDLELNSDLKTRWLGATVQGTGRELQLDETEDEILLFIETYALAKLWMWWGIHPKGFIGGQFGEYVAACLAGVFTLPDALELVAKRCQWIIREDFSFFEKVLARNRCSELKVPFISNLTGTWIELQEAFNPVYWAQQLVLPPEKTEAATAVTKLMETKEHVFLEVGFDTSLPLRISQKMSDMEQPIIRFLPNGKSEHEQVRSILLNILGELWLTGVSVAWNQLYLHETRCRIALPLYPFEHRRYWVDIPRHHKVNQELFQEVAVGQCVSPEPKEDIIPGLDMNLMQEIEELVIKVWQEVLGGTVIHKDHHFFEKGGDSLMASRVVNRIREILPIELPLGTLFSFPILNDFAAQVEHQVVAKMREMSE